MVQYYCITLQYYDFKIKNSLSNEVKKYLNKDKYKHSPIYRHIYTEKAV